MRRTTADIIDIITLKRIERARYELAASDVRYVAFIIRYVDDDEHHVTLLRVMMKMITRAPLSDIRTSDTLRGYSVEDTIDLPYYHAQHAARRRPDVIRRLIHDVRSRFN